MKKVFIYLLVVFVCTGCYTLQAPVVQVNPSLLRNYHYVYIIPTGSVSSSSGVYSTMYGVYGGDVSTTTPSEVIAGYLMKCGYTILPEIDPNLKDQTLIVSYGQIGQRLLSLFAYSTIVLIQFRDAKTHQLIASSEAEGCGENEAKDILQAITSALNALFRK